MRAELVGEIERAQALGPAWDALAIACSRPYSAPGWQLGWWYEAAPVDARPLLLVARQDEELVGLLALYGTRERTGLERLGIMGAAVAQGTSPLAVPGREREVGCVLGDAIAALRGPRTGILDLHGVPDGRCWGSALAMGWRGGARSAVLLREPVLAPVVTLGGGTVDDWLASRSANFRQQLRRSRRRLERRGAEFRRARTSSELQEVIPALVRLHLARWADRGGSQAIGSRTEAVICRAAAALGDVGRMHAEVIELDGRIISSHLFLAAGEEVTYWLGGFDEEYGAEHPGLLALLGGVEHALARGAARLDLGPGTHPYKLRFADRTRELDWLHVLPPGVGRPLARAHLAPRRLARAVRSRWREPPAATSLSVAASTGDARRARP